MSALRRAQLLPRSGIGVLAPWLVIAPPGIPAIRIDLRLLDRVRMHSEPGVVLVCRDLEVALDIADGLEAAHRVVVEAAPWTLENNGADKPLPAGDPHDRANRPASFGRLAIMSSSPDGEPRSDDTLAGFIYELTEPTMLVGRTDTNHVIINHRSISRVH